MPSKNNKGKEEAISLLASLKYIPERPTSFIKARAKLALETGLLDDVWLCKQAGLTAEEIAHIRVIAVPEPKPPLPHPES